MKCFYQWLKEVADADELCDWGREQALSAKSRKALADMALHAKAAGYLCRMERLGHKLPYDTILRDIPAFINGRYTATFATSNGAEYTSEMYCNFEGEIRTDATLLTLLGFKGVVYIEENSVVTIYSDAGCDFKVIAPDSSMVACEYWGKKPRAEEDSGIVFVKK